MLSAHSLFIIEAYSPTAKQLKYRTPSGTFHSKKPYQPGTLLLGNFYSQQKYRFKTIHTNENVTSIKIPFVSTMLNYRSDLSKKLYYQSGGRLTLPQALLLGDKSYLTNDTKDLFTLMGLNHLLAVSGMHVGLIGFLIFSFTSKAPKKVRYIITSLLLISYLPLAGFKIPVMRAVLFGISIMIAHFFDTKVNIQKLLLFLAGLFLLFSPKILTDISFILSFSAVYGILHFMKQGQSKPVALFMTGFYATAFTLPAILYSFGTLNLMSMIFTILYLPIIYLILATTIFSTIVTPLSIAPLTYLENIIHTLNTLLEPVAQATFVLNKIDGQMLSIMIGLLLVAIIYKKKWIIPCIFIFPFIHSAPAEAIHIPYMKRSKCIIDTHNTGQIFFQGQYNDFKYKVVPFLADIGMTSFAKGNIRIFGGQNHFIPIGSSNPDFKPLCINTFNDNCDIVFLTRSNSLKKSTIDINKKYIIYKNHFDADNIYQTSKLGDLLIIKGEINDDHQTQ